MVHAVAEF